MTLDATDISRMLYRHFVNYEYRLSNSFVYLWESDFFAMSKSGYFIEVEIKVSRGDFFRDFEKEKHKLFEAVLNKRSHWVHGSAGHGDLVCSYNEGKLITGRANGISYSKHNGRLGTWVNDSTSAYIRQIPKEIYAPASNVYFREVNRSKFPNQLYFACPSGLIKPEEIPPYAGLIYCGSDAEIIRRAPYVHKAKQDMTKELLKKFYHLWEYKQTVESKIELCGQFKLFSQKEINNRP